MNKLGKYFSLEELTATHENLVNTPGPVALAKLKILVANLLDPLREMIDEPIAVNSGYRTLAVNKAVGGARKPISQHTKGEAADIECFDNAMLFQTIREHFQFDQLIWEKGNDRQPDWVHVSFKSKGNRNQILKHKNGEYIQL